MYRVWVLSSDLRRQVLKQLPTIQSYLVRCEAQVKIPSLKIPIGNRASSRVQMESVTKYLCPNRVVRRYFSKVVSRHTSTLHFRSFANSDLHLVACLTSKKLHKKSCPVDFSYFDDLVMIACGLFFAILGLFKRQFHHFCPG